jgi:exopolysaccharide production protein ExoZ
MHDPAMSVAQDRRLQILRGIAALLVLIDHARLSMSDASDYAKVFNGFFGHLGTLGVALFFGLSGYLMLATNAKRFGSARASISFFARRWLRIAPLYYLATAAAAAALLATGRTVTKGELAASALFWPFFGHIESPGFYPVLGVGWTLNLEMAFYALFAVALASPRRIGMSFTLATILLGVGLGRAVAARWAAPSALEFYAQPVVLLFAFGVALAAFGRRWPTPPLWTAVAGALVLLAGLDAVGVAPGHVSLIAAACAAPVLAVGVEATPRAGMALARLGDASYSLYLFHTPLLIATNRIAAALGLALPLTFLFNLATAGGSALLAYPLLERPLRRRLEAPLRAWIDRAGSRQFALSTLRR